ncbi:MULTISPECIES: tyrosine-type recombinase/integrase [Cyanophyceae]|uniref:tyrosine-type recombinase/integrase n=1 Tax=Cyanophyceae TaxID=3028117 RepID=UPI001688D705|nr:MULTISPECIES: tyrosine-type recombinase/integrase [Cyanophyceae]MBD1918873.1 tyrosine-type recombinase/integrase [Phormidium sp. FACHB-77]MBD2033285.1 tyrosine-type recombinase/integrase [Phormidium sp. FACHB-322]MBD2053782.1 tyrosine-type recombinase/integrase [Leptolyngbya sp. FACHB-60]
MPATNSTIEILEQWLYGRAKRTQEEYLRDAEAALRFLGDRPLESLTLSDLQRYQAHLVEVRHLKHSSVRRKIAALRSLLRFAQEQGHIDRNPATALRSPKDTSSIHERILSRAQVAAIIAAAPEGKAHAALRLLYASGARASELCGLLWQDCLPQANGGVVVRLLGKGQKWRSVTVSAAVWEEVAALRSGVPDGSSVFGLNRRQLHDLFKAAAIAADCPHSSCHWARHSLATHLIEAGMPLAAVRDLLGHASIATTNSYVHSNPNQSASDYLSL